MGTTNRASLPFYFGFAAPTRGSGMQWSFSNKVSAIPQFLSFKTGVEEKSRKTVHEPIASLGFMPVSAADAFDSNQRQYSGVVQVCCPYHLICCSNI